MLKIGVNTRLLLKDRLEGIGRFTFEVLKRMTNSHPEIEFHFFFDRPFHQDFIFGDNVIPHVLSPQARHPFLFIWYFNRSIKAALKKEKIDLFFSPDGYLSLTTNVPQFPVIHDLNFCHRPKDLPFLMRWYYLKYFPKFAKIGAHIFTVSEFSKKDIHEQFNISNNRISVTYNGHEHIGLSTFQSAHNSPYILYVGSLHARKNVANTLLAFDELKQNDRFKDLQMIIVGQKMFSDNSIESVYHQMSSQKDVIFTGRISDDHLQALYKNAKLLVNFSFFEGFGIPIIEAFKQGTPVALSNATCFPEVAGEAGYYADPYDVRDMSNTIQEALLDENVDQRIALGKERLQYFSWDHSAQIIMDQILKYHHA